MPRPKTLRLAEFLEELGMSRAAYYRMAVRGLGPKSFKLPNGQIRFHQADVDAWFAELEDRAA
ncbi:hypothetical protein GCM10023205_57200 [Yinghuangia aomiensis]|uniref:Helix-turn-helix domain-containing protein n=1 Tax=Yinghuangia aomiensis TaxID=676205 RepID=A0ABP9HXC8_9ACTN